MEKENVIVIKSYEFAKDIIRLYQQLSWEKKEFILSKQILKSGTSIGANIEEAIGGYSKKDFHAKLGVSYKEARETKYWLRLLHDTDYISEERFDALFEKSDELARLLYAIIKSSK